MKKVLLILLSTLLCAAFAQDLLIGHTDPGQTGDVEEHIAGDPYYDRVDLENWCSDTPTVDHLLEYDCVFTWNGLPYDDRALLGHNLADYVDQGGAVVILNFCWGYSPWGLSGRIMDDSDYCPLTLVYRCGGRDDQDLGDYDPDHPIMAGVESITGIYYWIYLGVWPDATWIASLTNGYALVGINAWENVVGINMYPGDNRRWSGDGWILLNNAIQYIMGEPGTVAVTSWGRLKAVFE
ncbi:hypothetical protein KAU45_00655 [bacterium]|nr:hypothetical protein [bacterium]